MESIPEDNAAQFTQSIKKTSLQTRNDTPEVVFKLDRRKKRQVEHIEHF